MSTTFCPECHRPMPPETRAGVRLTPLKARVFDIIQRAGVDGIGWHDISGIGFDGRASRHTVKAHVHQINEQLSGSGVAIVCSQGAGALYQVKGKSEK